MSYQIPPEVTDIVEGAAVTYWARKVAQGDTEPGDRVIPSVYVRNHAQYAGVAAGQVVAGHALWAIVLGPLYGAWVMVTFVACVVLPMFALASGPSGTLSAGAALIGLGLFLLWLYLFCWRLSLKPLLRFLFHRGPGIAYGDGYTGPLGIGETTYTTKFTGYPKRRPR